MENESERVLILRIRKYCSGHNGGQTLLHCLRDHRSALHPLRHRRRGSAQRHLHQQYVPEVQHCREALPRQVPPRQSEYRVSGGRGASINKLKYDKWS